MASSEFVLYMFKEDHEQIASWVLRYPDLETGGSLFGLWTSNRDPVAHVILGPGKDSRRTGVSFFQDISYLGRVGNLLTHDYMLCHIGEWHSHHRLRLYEPSSGDVSTVVRNYPEGVHGFVLMIANIISEKDVSLSPYLFTEYSCARHIGARYEPGEVKFLDGGSPFRKLLKIDESLKKGKEIFKERAWWETPSTDTYGYGRAASYSHDVHLDSHRLVPTNEKPQQKQRSVCITQSKIEKYNVNKDQPFQKQHHEDRQQSEVEPMDVCEDYEINEDKSKGTAFDQHPNRNEEGSIFLGKAGFDTSELTELKTRVVVEGTSSVSDEKKGMGHTSREEKPFAVTATGPATYSPSKQSATYQNRNECIGDSRVPEKERCLQLEGSDPQGHSHPTAADRRHTDPITTRHVTYPPGVTNYKYQRHDSVTSSSFDEKDKVLQLAGLDPQGSSCATAIGAPEKVFANSTAAGSAGHPPYVPSARYQGNENMALSRCSEQNRMPQRAGVDHPGHSPSIIAGTPSQLYTSPTATGAVVYQHTTQSTHYKDERTTTWRSAEQDRGLQLVGDRLGVTPSIAVGTPGRLYTSPTSTSVAVHQHITPSAQYKDERMVVWNSAEQGVRLQPVGGLGPLGVTPSTVVEAPQQMYTKSNQWYSSTKGQEDLKTIQRSLSRIADGEVAMSRDSATHDLTMSFEHHGKKWVIEFSSNFPYSGTKLKQEKYQSYKCKFFNETARVISSCFISGVLKEVKDVVKLYCSKCSTSAYETSTCWSRH